MPEQSEASGGGAERRPLWYGLSAAIVILALALGYRIAKGDGQVDVSGGADGIQVKISQAQKTIASAQQEMAAAQQQLDERQAALAKAEQALKERDRQLQALVAQLTSSAASSEPKLSPKQAQAELKRLQSSALPVSSASQIAVKPRLEKLDELSKTLGKTSSELSVAAKAPQK